MGAQVKPAEQLGCGPAAPGDQLPKALRDILTKARTSWLRNSEVVDLLTNYRAYNFRVSKEAPVKPAGLIASSLGATLPQRLHAMQGLTSPRLCTSEQAGSLHGLPA